MFTRFTRLALFLCLLAPSSPAHQGGNHPTGYDSCEDIYYALEWFHLYGEGVESATTKNPLQPQEYFVTNNKADGAIPKATVKIAWALGAQHITSYNDFVVTVTIGNTRTYTGNVHDVGTTFVIDPIIDGWMGTMSVVIQHKTCDFSMSARAHWVLEDPRTPKCKNCANLTCDGRGEIKSVNIGIPIGPIRHGGSQIELGYESDQVANEGAAKLAVLGQLGPYGASVTKVDDVLTTVTAGRHFARILNTPSVDDPEKVRVEVSYDETDPDNTIYRTATLESIGGVFRYTDTVAGKTTTRDFTHPSADTWVLTEDDLQRTTKEKRSENLTSRTYRFTVEERDAADNWTVVEQHDDRETNYSWGWTLTRRTVDPLGQALVTEWDYYTLTEFSGPNSDINGRGRLQSTTYPTGLVRSHQYYDTDPLDPAFDQLEVTTEAFAGTPGAKVTRIHSKYAVPFLTQREEHLLNGNVVEQIDITARYGKYRIETRYPSDGGPAQVTRYDYNDNPGTPFLLMVTNPDGTVEISHEINSNGQKTTKLFKGTYNEFSSTLPLFTGTIETSTVNEDGQLLHSSRSVVRGGVAYPIEEKFATSLDYLERPLAYDIFHGAQSTPTYSETMEYGCCGVSQSTGQDGIPTFYYYDDLGRVAKTHRNGLASETVYDGLTTHAHTYPEAIPSSLSLATPANEAGFLTRDLTGQIVAQGSRSPQDDSLLTTTTVTTYAPAPGLGMRTVTTAPQTPDDLGVPPTVTADSYLDGLPASTRGSLVPDVRATYDANATGMTTTTARLDAGGTPFEAVTTQHDWLGRAISMTYAGDANGDGQPDQSFTDYDAGGRPTKITDPDGVTTLFAYDLTNESTTIALDLNNDGLITIGTDEIRLSRRGQFLDPSSALILWSEEAIRDDANLERILSRRESRSDGLETWSYAYDDSLPALAHSLTTYLSPGAWDTASDLPDGRRAIQRYRNARLDNDESLDANGTSLATRSYSYDPYQRVTHITDSSGPDLQTTYLSDHLDFASSQTLGTHTTTFSFDHRGRSTVVDAPDSLDATGTPVDNRRTTSYFPHGAIRDISGTPGYHLGYTYDDAHRLATLTTYGTQTTVTRWLYTPDRGLLAAKLHHSPTPATGSGPSYTYSAAGRLLTRLSERGITTTHTYDSAGRPASTTYSDGTPAVTILDRDSRGRVTRLSDAAGPRALTYNDYNSPTSTTFEPGHLFAGWSLPQTRDPLGRLTALTAHDGSADQHHLAFTYDPASRLESVQANNLAAWYHYDPANLRVAQLSVSNSQQPLLFSTRSYDDLNRLSRINYHNGDVHGQFALYADHQLQRDAYGHLTSTTRTDGTQWRFGYNPSGELTTANLHRDATSSEHVLGHSLAWSYDGIGNRTSSKGGGDSSGAGQHQSTHTSNPLNQYTAQTSPGLAEIFGEAPPATEVLVNSTPASRQGPFFHHSVSADNSSGPLWQPITVENEGNTTSGHHIIPPASLAPTHDADGNLLSNGLWQFTWDAENRLTQAESTSAATSAGIPYRKITSLYDAESRRLQRQVFDAPASPTPIQTTRFLYAGWRLLAELNETNTVQKTFAWGLDNNDSLHLGDPNAALLWIHDHQTTKTHLTHYDHNGNITGLLSAQTQQPTATYNYSPFGQLLTATGPYAENNPYRFSTQYQDPETQLLYYGLRHLDPETGRWLSRDPLGELLSSNLYAAGDNDLINGNDMLGATTSQQALRVAALWGTAWVGGKIATKQSENRDVRDAEERGASYCDELRNTLLRAQLAAAAYENVDPPDGWIRINFINDESGLDASLLQGPDNRTVIAFRGTTDWSDWKANAVQSNGWIGSQFFGLRGTPTQWALKYPDAEVVGHSLGGALAAVFGTRYQRTTTTFNPSGVHLSTSIEYDIKHGSAYDQYVNRYTVTGEVLNSLQDKIPFLAPDSQGIRHRLQPANLRDPVSLHGMEFVINAIEARLDKCCKNRYPSRHGLFRNSPR